MFLSFKPYPSAEMIWIVNTGGTFSSLHGGVASDEVDGTLPLSPPCKNNAGRQVVHDAIMTVVKQSSLKTKCRHLWLGVDEGNPDDDHPVELIDSSALEPTSWNRMMKFIKYLSEKPGCKTKGVVLIHGTDSLAYTAAALSFVVAGSEWASFPIIVTGSQLPLAVEPTAATDATRNLCDSLCAIDNASGMSCFVKVQFGGKLMVGSRVVKVHASSFTAFDCPRSAAGGGDLLGVMGAGGLDSGIQTRSRVGRPKLLLPYAPINPHVNVVMIRLTPGVDLRYYCSQELCKIPKASEEKPVEEVVINGIIIEAFGSGNGATCGDCAIAGMCKSCIRFHHPLKQFAKEIPVFFVSDCAGGSVSGAYKTNLESVDGVTGLSNATSEAVFCKLLYAISAAVKKRGKHKTKSLLADVKRWMTRVVADEFTQL
jgi:L-asparaginase